MTRTSVDATTVEPIAPIAEAEGVTGFVAQSANRASFSVANPQLSELMSQLSELGIEAIESQPPTLEELFMRHYAVEPNHGTEP